MSEIIGTGVDFVVLSKYLLWVGGTQVTSDNASNIGGKNWASYKASTRTLTLNGYSYKGEDSGIKYTGSESLNLVLIGANSIKNTKNDGVSVNYANLNISGTGSLTVSSTGDGADAMNIGDNNYYRDLTIENATLTLNGVNNGLYIKRNLIIKNGTVKVTGDYDGIWSSTGSVVINGGTVTAAGNHLNDGCGIHASTAVIITGGSISATGTKRALEGTVRNTITGIGWKNVAGTEGKADIAKSIEGQTLNYKKVQFPAVKAPATVKKAPEAKTLTYTGSAQELVTAGTAEGGEMQYALGTKDAATGTYSAFIPTKTDARTYYVWYKVVGDTGHSDTEPHCIPVIIAESKELYFYKSGAHGTWQKEIGGGLSFRISRTVNDEVTFGKFTGIEVDGKRVGKTNQAGKTNYEAKSGSVIIELKPAFLGTLSIGEHRLTAVFEDGKTETFFTVSKSDESDVKDANLPQTGDAQKPLFYVALAIICLAGIGLLRKKM